jgi:hypothetical protein
MNIFERLWASQLPELYKYAPLDSPERIDHLRDVVTNNRLWCANPVAFNDPFDFRPFQDFDAPEFRENYFRYFRIVLREQNPLMSSTDIDGKITEALKGFLSHPTRQENLPSLVRKGGICCLTESGNNLLMWAHYTRGHNGYVLKFNSPNWMAANKLISYRVEYEEKYPTVDIWKPYFENLKPAAERNPEIYYEFTQISALTKSSHWAYEKEWRLIRPEPGYVNFDPENLTQIIFGVAVQSHIIQEIRQLISRRKSSIELLKAELDKNTFRINYILI